MLRLCECQLRLPRCRPEEKNKKRVHRELVVRCLGGAFTGDEATPRFMAFMNDRRSVFLVLGLAGESELVLGLAVGDLVNAVGGGGEE
jgi:hypothetical protein